MEHERGTRRGRIPSRHRGGRRGPGAAVVAALVLVAAGGTALGLPGALAAGPGPHRSVAVSAAGRAPGTSAVSPAGHRHRPWRPAPSRTPVRPSTPAPSSSTPAPLTPVTPTPTAPGATVPPASSTAAPSAPAARGVTENWAGTSAPGYRLAPRGGSTVTSGRTADGASDGRAAALTIPAGAGSSPANAAELESRSTFTSGSFGARVRTPDCSGQPATGAVTGIFTYGNDGRDHDGDGIVDNSELDVEILCARPSELNLTIWTDYADTDARQRRVTRVVDLRTGRVVSTGFCTDFSGSCQPVTAAESAPASVTAVPGFDSSAAFHDYRIDWSPDRVVFTVAAGGRDVVLWDYRGPRDRIPQGASAFLVNLWHTDDWSPAGLKAVARPTAPLTALVDATTIPAAG